MPFVLACLLFSTPLNSLQGTDSQDKWLSEDKFEHIFVSSFLLGITYYLSHYEFERTKREATQVAIGLSLSTGILKELYDLKDRGTPSFKDILADVVGIIIGILIFTK